MGRRATSCPCAPAPRRWPVARRALVLLSFLALAALLVAALLRLERLPEGPVPLAWDRTACAHCHMHVGEPALAAQLQTKDGAVLHFDDPGCLLLHLEKEAREMHAIYFRHLREERWIPAVRVAFV